MNSKKIIFYYIALFVSLLLLASCAKQKLNSRLYVLNAQRPGAPMASAGDEIVIEVQRFAIDAAFSEKGFVYRKGEYEYESDFYNEFLVSPAEMITEKTRSWLSHSGQAKTVLDKGSFIKPTYALRGNIGALYGDFRDQGQAEAVMEIRMFLIDETRLEEKVIFAKTYNSSNRSRSLKVEDIVQAWDQCLVDILTDMEKDIAPLL